MSLTQTMLSKQQWSLNGVVDTVSDWFRHTSPRPRSPSPTSTSTPDFSRTRPNEYCQRQCRGCREICELLRWGEVQRRRDSAYQGSSPSRIMHSNYLELDLCAGVSGCDTCRIIRRAFLLEQITGEDAERLEYPTNQWPIYAVLRLASSGDGQLLLAIKSPHATLFSAAVQLSDEPRPVLRDATKGGARLRPDLGELCRVIHDCHNNHECSSRYRWSRRNPTWLLKILPDHHAQLTEGPATPVDYVVLSYSWGDPATMPAAEWAKIKSAGTKTINGRPVPERLRRFSTWELPETMQDAIAVTAALGFSYIWIDNICIPKGTNWDTEAARMHEVYGNAAFTLVASSSSKATDNLLHDRLAWTHRNKACKLRGMWLQNTQMPLDQVRLQSPVSQRAWTLQEERLSPRTLYWSGQRWYWSCAERQVVELSDMECQPSTGESITRSCPQRFLELCRTGDEHQLHDEWLDIVEAYTPRDLVAAKDRFLAIAGLAVRFYNAKADNGGAMISEEYLAGLWKDNFARHLAWSVESAANAGQSLQHIAPSWSWMSLPLQVNTRTKHAFKQSEHFKFVSVAHIDTPHHTGSPTDTDSERVMVANFVNRGQAVEERGRDVKVVQVQGRFRRFIAGNGREVSWRSIEWKRGSRLSFDFGAFPDEHIYARNKADGRIMSRDAHSGEVVGQLDYLAPLDDNHPVPLDDGRPKTRPTPAVQDGQEKALVCLELGESAMLLLMPSRKSGYPDSYTRVGVAIGYGNRKGFFYGCETRRVYLC